MNGFLGYLETDPGAAAAMTKWMAAWHGVRPKKAAFTVELAPFGFLASQETAGAPRPVASEPGGLHLLFDGFIAADQLKDPAGREPRTESDIAATLLRLYREHGAESLVGLNGRYVIVVWDPARRSLEMMNDILGLRPIFLWQSGASFAFSTNAWAIVCHPRFRKAINRKALADLLLLTHQQAQRTLHEEISVLPPGSLTTVCEGKMTSREVRTLKFSDQRWTWSFGRLADEMHALLAQSARRQLPDGAEVCLPLSGGFDSRVLLGLLCERTMRIHAITQYQHGLFSLDARYAQVMAKAMRVPIKVVPLADQVLADYREKCVAINGGTYDTQTGRFLSLLDQTDWEPMPVVSAHLGGELTSRFQVHDSRFTDAEEHFARAFGAVNMYRFPRERVRALFEGRTPVEIVEESYQDCRRFFLEFDGPFFQRYFHWDLLSSRRRYIAYQLFYYEQFAPVRAPFYDRDFVDFMCSIPFAAIEGQRAYMEMMARHYPKLAKVPNTNTDLPVTVTTKAVVQHFLHNQYQRAVQRPLHKMLRLRRWIGHPMEQYGFALAGDSRAVLDHLLASADRMSPYIHPDQVRAAVERQLAQDNSCVMGLLGLSTFATTLEFLDDPYAAIRAWERAPAEGG